MKTKIAFFEVDGTLIEMGTGKMNDQTRNALCSLQKNGVKLVVCTGRSPLKVPRFDGFDWDAEIAFNGACIEADGKVISSRALDPADMEAIVRSTEKLQRGLAAAGRDFFSAKRTDPALVEYFGFSKTPIQEDPDFDLKIKEPVYQLMVSCSPEEYKEILKNTHSSVLVSWWNQAADVVSKECSKGNALREVLDYYGFSREESIAFGDGLNDVSMLEAAGLGIAVDNADDEVKKHADLVIGSVSENGVAAYLENTGLI